MEKRAGINHLKELKHSHYKIADDQPHIDDWKIVDRADKKVGRVDDILFDEDRRKVRYIVSHLKDGEIMNKDSKVLIPIGQAQLDTNNKKVIVPNITSDHLNRLPKYEHADNLTQDEETLVLDTFSGTKSSAPYHRDTFYENEHFNEDKFYDHGKNYDRRSGTTDQRVDVVEENLEVGKREVQTGGARITSRIVERPVEERVNLREEHVEVKRNPVDRPASKADMDHFQERTIEETESKEVPVVTKKARVKEEITLEKDVKNREEIIKDKVRRTEVDIDRKLDKKDKDVFASRKRSNTEKSDKNKW